MRFKNNRLTTFAEEFIQAIAIINPVAVAQFFEAICIRIFKYFLAAESIKSGFLGLLSMYFRIVEINGQKMLYFYCLV